MSKEELYNLIAQTGALRISTEGNNPHYTSRVLKKFVGKPVTIYGYLIDDENPYKIEIGKLLKADTFELNEKLLKSRIKSEVLEKIKKLNKFYYPKVLRIEGEIKGKSEVLFLSKILRVESENFERDFLVDDKYEWVFMGGDDSCWVMFPKE